MQRRRDHLRLVHSAAAPRARMNVASLFAWTAPLAILAASVFVMATYP